MSLNCTLPDHCQLAEGPNGLEVVRVANALGRAEIARNGAHVTSFAPRGASEVLWLSERSAWSDGAPIRGGVPVCWPWFAAFGPAGGPAHGVARISQWDWVDAAALATGATRLRFALAPSATTRDWAPAALRVELLVTVGSSLDIALRVHNPSTEPFTFAAALHSYFTVGDARQVWLTGLEGCHYEDRLLGQHLVQDGPVRFSAEADRIYADQGEQVLIHDPVLERRISVRKRGSASTVVWNPWVAKSAFMPDFGDDEWPGMCCVETANVGDAAITLAPGGVHEMGVTIALD
ncbi:MAG: D-hexose-6-phosphate mutarotase [Planctomycetota bacterium]|jgi:glucose-6-phosphate 1-epimerase|nr:D-hexose-6-phosphate mutarotase [Planctomycetota bacterium]